MNRRHAYNTTHTAEGAVIETHLNSLWGPGYLKISEPISMEDLLSSCSLTELRVYNRAHGIDVAESEFTRIAGKTFTPGGGAWSVTAQTLKGTSDRGEVPCRFEVQESADGCAFVTAYADVPTPGGPTIQVQLDVEFD